METKTLLSTLQHVTEEASEQQMRNICWYLAIHHPLEFMGAANAGGFMTNDESDELLKQRVINLAKQEYDLSSWCWNGKIPLIKTYRTLTGDGLMEAKDWVEAHFDFSDGIGRARI